MTFRVYKSQIVGFDFEKAVADFIYAKLNQVEDVPAPTAEAMVEAAVRRVPSTDDTGDNWVPDYEIIDDLPTPEELRAKETAELINQSRQQEQNEINALMPAGKGRLFALDVADAAAVPEANRNQAQRDLIAAMETYQAQVRAIQRRGAERESEIGDRA